MDPAKLTKILFIAVVILFIGLYMVTDLTTTMTSDKAKQKTIDDKQTSSMTSISNDILAMKKTIPPKYPIFISRREMIFPTDNWVITYDKTTPIDKQTLIKTIYLPAGYGFGKYTNSNPPDGYSYKFRTTVIYGCNAVWSSDMSDYPKHTLKLCSLPTKDIPTPVCYVNMPVPCVWGDPNVPVNTTSDWTDLKSIPQIHAILSVVADPTHVAKNRFQLFIFEVNFDLYLVPN